MKAPVRHIVTDFASSVVMALSIGVITSVALASAVVLIAAQSGSQQPGSLSASDTAQILGEPAAASISPSINAATGASIATSAPGGD